MGVTENWLKGRRQRVCITGRWSNWITVWSGVPQGSVLGPLLFLIFINDLDEGIRSHILKFAYDTRVFQELRDETDCSTLQSDLDKLLTWAEKWQMDFNVKKCKVMHVTEEQLFLLHGRNEINRGGSRKRFRSLDFSRHEVFSAMHVCI